MSYIRVTLWVTLFFIILPFAATPASTVILFHSTSHDWQKLTMLWSNIMKLKNKFLRMSDLANQPERKAKTYTTKSGQQRTVTAKAATRGITGFSAKHIYSLIKIGHFPAPVKVGRASLWRMSDINSWLDSHAGHTDDYANDKSEG